MIILYEKKKKKKSGGGVGGGGEQGTKRGGGGGNRTTKMRKKKKAVGVTLYVVEIGDFGSVCLSIQRLSLLDTRTDSDLANGVDRERAGAWRERTRGVLLACRVFKAELGLAGVLLVGLLAARATAAGLSGSVLSLSLALWCGAPATGWFTLKLCG